MSIFYFYIFSFKFLVHPASNISIGWDVEIEKYNTTEKKKIKV